jgi:ribosomal 30S subunit maturation factor RimM
MENFYKVGTIVNTQGLQGEVRILPSTDFANERFSKGAVLALFDDKDNYIQDFIISMMSKNIKVMLLKLRKKIKKS